MHWIHIAFAQIGLIISLLIGAPSVAPIVPQDASTPLVVQKVVITPSTSTEAINALETTPTSTTPIQVNITVEPATSGTIQVPMTETPAPNTPAPETLKPVYTEDELLKLFFNNTPKALRKGSSSVVEGMWPVVVVNVGSTTATIGQDKYNKNWGEVEFGGKIIVTTEGKSTTLTDLTPNTYYTYVFIWHEEGREDTLIEKTFKTTP